MSWTDERVELLKKMWGEGQSASQIAKELGGVTRNAVIGKVHRLGLSNRTGGGGSAPKAEPKPKAVEEAKKSAPSKPAPAPAPSSTDSLFDCIVDVSYRDEDSALFFIEQVTL